RSILTMKARIAAAGAAALLMLPACSGSKIKSEPAVSTSSSLPPSKTSGTATTTTRTTPSTATTDPSKQLVASVRAFWDLYLQLGARARPFNAAQIRSLLGQRTIGKELTKLYDVFQGNAVAGAIVKGTIDIAPTVVSITATTAQVSDCYDDKTGLYRFSDGKRIDTDDPRRHKVLMTLTRVGAAWKVSAIKDEGLGCTV
nr:Tim44 domain-containing protein [Actinomycetota bacterium]